MLFARFFVIAGALIVFITLFCDAVDTVSLSVSKKGY